jgi:predicted CDP-diglyceride synthetase/phosphatidate cytidylyltransferase
VTIEFIQLLSLIIIANGAPILIRVLLRGKLNLAIDFGRTFPDKRPVFGPSKTWRGIFASLLATSVAAWLLGYSPETGFLVAFYAITGDLLSSTIKRRLAMKPSSMAPILDQVPESLFPALMMKDVFMLNALSIILLVSMFIIIELALSHVLYDWGIRKKSY